MDESIDPVAALENIPIDYRSPEVQKYKVALSDKIIRMKELLQMYQVKKQKFHHKIHQSLHTKAHEWVEPQINLTAAFISQTERVIKECDKSTFNSSNILDFLENLYAYREEQKRINDS